MLASVYLAVLTTIPQPGHIQAAVVLNAGVETDTGNDGNDGGGDSNGNFDNVEVIFTDVEAREENAGNDGDDEGDTLDVGRMTFMVDRMTPDDWLVFVCEGVPGDVPDCRGVPSIR